MIKPELDNIIREACVSNEQAYVFVNGCFHYFHMIDDLMDGEVKEDNIREYVINLLNFTKDLFSTPFYQNNRLELSGVIDMITNAYADSLAWESADKPFSSISNVIRSQGNDIICIVAKIIGGYNLMRSVSLKIRELSVKDQQYE